MSSDVVLTAALRNNLLSLQNTQSLIDQTQLRLATGLKVNSALDDPGSFFAAQSLDNRASDLSRLLDGIGQSIRAIEVADQGVTALTGLVEQADSIVSSARDELAAAEGRARVIGDVDLRDTTDITSLAGIDAADTFTISTTDDNGDAISETITVAAGTAESLASQITNAFADNQNGEVSARITSQGFLEVSTTDGRSFRVQDSDVGSGTEVTLAGFQALGLGDAFVLETTTGPATRAAATVVGGSTISSTSIYEADGDLAEAGDTIVGTDYIDGDGNTILGGATLLANDVINVSVDGQTENITLTAATTFQEVVDTINNSTNVGDLIEADFDAVTGQIRITSISGDASSVSIGLTAAAGAGAFDLEFGDPTGNLQNITVANGDTENRTYAFSKSTAALATLAADYNEVRNQIDRLVVDTNYRGINLLGGDDLTTNFNEDRTSTLTTEGTDFSATGVGINETTFGSDAIIETAADEVRSALENLRSFGTTLANDLAIIQTRQDFTESTINTLQAGADDLTVADQNEEGANLLALQTRQTLGVTSLSLASQSQQAVLRLF